MDLLQLRYLCTAARYENFSRAARHHNIPQSAISKTVAQLERELGIPLFVRKGNRVVISDRGKIFCRRVQAALDLLGDAVREASAEPSLLQGELRLIAEEHSAAVLRIVSAFRTEHPGVAIRLRTAPSDLDYDLRISATALCGDKIGSTPLREATLSLLLPATHRLAEWERITPEALAGTPLCTVPTAHCTARAVTYLRKAGIVCPLAVECDDMAALRSCITAGMGVAFVSGLDERDVAEAGLVLRALAGPPTAYATCLAWRRPLSPVAEAFSLALLAHLRAPETELAKTR